MHALTTAAVQNFPLLRRLQQGGVESKAVLAAQLGKDPSNLNRAMKSLEAEGLISGLEITEAGSRVLLAADVADGKANPVREGDAERVWTHGDLEPNPDQPRKTFDPEALEQRAASIKAVGQLQNLLARPHPKAGGPALQIVAGESRWRAMALLIERGDWPADHPVKVDVRDLSDEEVDRISLIENVQRANLTMMEEATAYRRLNKVHKWSTARIADEVGKTTRFVQLRIRLLQLTEAEQQQLEDGEITFKQAQAILDRRPKPLELNAAQLLIVAEVIAAAAGVATAYHWLKAECDPIAAAAAIEEHQLGDALALTGPDTETGAFSVGIAGEAYLARVAAQYPDLITSSRAAVLRSIRARAATADDAEEADDTGKHLTAWLNGPFALTPEGLAAKEANEQKERDRATEDAQAEARHALAMKRLNEASETTAAVLLDLGTDAPAPVGPHAEMALAFEVAGSPLPWRVEVSRRDSANLVDRDGKPVDFQWGGVARQIRTKLLMAAVNAAVGFAPSVIDVEPEPEQAIDGSDPDAEGEADAPAEPETAGA